EAQFGDLRLKIFKAQAVTPSIQGTIGQVVTDHKNSLMILCGSGTALSLTEIQPENRKRLKIHEFLQGFRGNFPFNKIGN
ncbi:MAG: hypothetical protein ACKOA8_18430, partial [Deltaproteobacteria bacterium]